MFNTLKYAKMLEESGFSKDQAETSIKILDEIMEEKLATKQDIKDIRQDIHALELRLTSESKQEFQRIDASISQAKSDLTIRMGTMLGAAIAILTAIQKLV